MEEVTRAGVMLGDRLRELRKKRGVTQVVLAEKSGLLQSHLRGTERGEKLPNVLTLIRLAAALECKVSAFVTVFDKEDLARLLPK